MIPTYNSKHFHRILFLFCCGLCFLVLMRLQSCKTGDGCLSSHEGPKVKPRATSLDIKQFLEQDCLKPKEMKNDKYEGRLNVHRWFDSCPCGYTIDRGLRIYNRFPRQPETQTVVKKTEIVVSNLTCSQRIFGYISPTVTGAYKFAISSGDNSELWVSRDSSPKNVELVAYVGHPDPNKRTSTNLRQYNKTEGQISKLLNLQRGHDYYIEALHRNQNGYGHISIAWQKPGMNGNKFILIDPVHLSLYLPEEDDIELRSEYKECILDEHGPLNLRLMPSVNAKQLADERDEMCSKYRILDHSTVADVLVTCPYQPSYLPQHRVPMYHGANFYAPYWLTDFYPDDKTGGLFEDRIGNTLIDRQEVNAIVAEYMRKLRASKGQQYNLKKVLNMERKRDVYVRGNRWLGKPDIVRGNRYLLELELETKGKDKSVRLSEYVFKFNKSFVVSGGNLSTDLCYPEGFQWNRDAKVYIILPVKNYGYWVKYFIDELIKIYENTAEKNFHLVLIDFNSTDFNAKTYLQSSVLRDSYTLVEMDGSFIKTLAINKGAAAVKDANSIIFLMDLHITIPPCFFDIIRKHTIKGKSGFFPEVFRLKCSTSELYPDGSWDLTGYGLLATYKQDWDKFGGEDVEHFRYRWGGEDWDLLDRVLNAKLDSERFKWSKLFHFHHAKKGSWYADSQD